MYNFVFSGIEMVKLENQRTQKTVLNTGRIIGYVWLFQSQKMLIGYKYQGFKQHKTH